MGVKETHSTNKDSGKITQIDYTEKRTDGKIETRHVNPDSGKYTGKSVHNPETGRTEHYTREEAGMGSCCHITTACLRALNLPEDSLEFKAMKILTKDHILKSRQGKRDYISYSRLSPKIVREIEARTNSREIWIEVYKKLRETTQLVSDKKLEEGYRTYKNLVTELGRKFA